MQGEPATSDDRRPRGNPGALVFAVAIVFCSMESVPEWSRFGTNWPFPVYLAIMAVFGAIAGALEVDVLRWAGAASGSLAGMGALQMSAWVLQTTERIPIWALIGAEAVGMLPGVGAYYLIKACMQVSRGEPRAPEPEQPVWMGDTAGRRRRLRIILAVFGVGLIVLVLLANFRR